METLNFTATGISIAGSIIIIWGVLKTIFNFLKNEKNKLYNLNHQSNSGPVRYQFSGYLILGLDFMLAADIIHTIHNPVLNELYVLAMIVGIRSVINFFLINEMRNGKSNI